MYCMSGHAGSPRGMYVNHIHLKDCYVEKNNERIKMFAKVGRVAFVNQSLLSYRYNSLSEPCHIRRDNLEEALRMYQFFRDVEDELSWIQEKRPTAESTDLGHSLSDVQNLMKKHQVDLQLDLLVTNWEVFCLCFHKTKK